MRSMYADPVVNGVSTTLAGPGYKGAVPWPMYLRMSPATSSTSSGPEIKSQWHFGCMALMPGRLRDWYSRPSGKPDPAGYLTS